MLAGEIDATALRERALAATRQLAKRQVTWLRSFTGLARLDGTPPHDAGRALFHSFL